VAVAALAGSSGLQLCIVAAACQAWLIAVVALGLYLLAEHRTSNCVVGYSIACVYASVHC
jgi:hypothetical protein